MERVLINEPLLKNRSLKKALKVIQVNKKKVKYKSIVGDGRKFSSEWLNMH